MSEEERKELVLGTYYYFQAYHDCLYMYETWQEITNDDPITKLGEDGTTLVKFERPSKMDSNRTEVQKFLENHFELNNFVVTEFPALPGGVIVQDRAEQGNNGGLLIYWDINKQKVMVK
jgi:hypothetical protein